MSVIDFHGVVVAVAVCNVLRNQNRGRSTSRTKTTAASQCRTNTALPTQNGEVNLSGLNLPHENVIALQAFVLRNQNRRRSSL